MSKNRVRQQALSATARANPSPAATLPPPAAALPTPTANTNPNPSPAVTTPHPAAASLRPTSDTNPNPSPAVTTPHPAAASFRPTSDTNPNPSPAVTTPHPAAASLRPMSDTTTVLNNLLKELRLPTFREQFQALADQAAREGLSYPQYLAELVRRECQTRNHSRIQRLLRNARLLPGKTWAQFNWSRVPLQVARQLQSLREGTFLDRRENLLVFGKPGSGKTHLLAALGEQLVQRGRSVLFATCSLLVQELLAAKRDLKLERFIKRLAKVEALIIDDLGYVQQSREEMEVLFILLAERYERGSVLLTSNQPFSQWQQIFKDPMTTAAAIDRLVHHSVIIELNITSYRLETAKTTRKTSNEAHPSPPSP